MDTRVLDAQKWVNKTYKGKKGFTPVPEDGRPGTVIMETLVVAFQIELGIENPTGYFGNATATAYNKHVLKYGDQDSDKNLVRILQHALFCKGYNPTAVSGYFGDETLKAVKKVQTDAGLSSSNIGNTIPAKVMKQILTSDALVLVYGGDTIIRSIQQRLNRDYSDMFDLISCDGRYNAQTNEALIYAFQIEGGMDKKTANGNFGPMTQDIARAHVLSVGSKDEALVLLAKYALYINGVRHSNVNPFDCSSNGTFSPVFDDTMESKVKAFQKFCGMLKNDGKIDISVWMSLMVSTGYPKRDVLACDTSTQLTATKAKRIYANDFRIVGRYLTGRTLSGPKFLTREELTMLFNQGLSVFAIYQDETQYYHEHPDEMTTVNYYNHEQGYNDAEKAVKAAEELGIPYGETIFFAVDYDFNNKQTTNMIIPHFTGINDYMRKNGNKYNVGCYGPRNICTRVSNCGYAKWSFISDMSTGFSGNKGFILPDNWVFDQIREYTQGAADGGFALDCVATSGKYNGFNVILSKSEMKSETDEKTDALSFYQNTLHLFGIEANLLAFDKEYVFDMGVATVKYQAKLGEKVTLGSDERKSVFEVKDGQITDATYETSLKVAEDLYYNNSLGIDTAGMLDFQNKIQHNIENGYIEVGFNVKSDGRVCISYLIHRENPLAAQVHGFTEIAILIEYKETLSKYKVEEYNARKEGLLLNSPIDAQAYFDISFSMPAFDLQATHSYTLTEVMAFIMALLSYLAEVSTN